MIVMDRMERGKDEGFSQESGEGGEDQTLMMQFLQSEPPLPSLVLCGKAFHRTCGASSKTRDPRVDDISGSPL